MYNPVALIPSPSASSSNGAQTPDLAIDGDTTTYWESQSETNPYIQIDLTKILRVFRIEVRFGSVNVPTTFRILSSDVDGTQPGDTEYGTFSNQFNRVQTVNNPTASVNNVYTLTPAQDARYIRIEMVGTGQMRIYEITIYASSNIANTAARVKIGSTYVTADTHVLLELRVQECPISDKISEVSINVNNKNEKYTLSTFASNSRILCWIDGVLKLYGVVTLPAERFDVGGFVMTVQAKDYGEFFINQTIRNAWAATTISDQTLADDIITKGDNSILGQVLSSVGARLFPGTSTGYQGVVSTDSSPNIFPYFKSQNVDAWNLLKTLQSQAIDGAWITQNPTFNKAGSSYSLLTNALSDGFWVAFKTASGYILRFPASGLELDVTPVILNNDVVTSLNNYNSALTYDGSIANENNYQYVEATQPVYVKISQLSNASALAMSYTYGTSVNYGDGASIAGTPSQIEDFIIECATSYGTIRRLHYLSNATTLDGGVVTTITTTDTDSDKYLTLSSPRNLNSDWVSLFGSSGTNDIVTFVRIRLIPYVKPRGASPTGGTTQRVRAILPLTFTMTVNSGVKIPPTNYDFYVSSTLSSGTLVPDLMWFSKPRLGLDLDRNLDENQTIRFYSNFPRSDINNLISFEVQDDPYTLKNEIEVTGTQITPFQDKTSINARDALYLSGTPPYHGSVPPQVLISDSTNMNTAGRRRIGKDISSHNQSEVARTAVEELSTLSQTVRRVIIRTKGNANLTPGRIVYLDSSYSTPIGYYYIISANHMWTVNGYETEITATKDMLRFSTELARLQGEILTVASRKSGSQSTKQGTKKIAFSKVSADLNGVELSQNPEAGSTSQPSLRFPLNLVPEFSDIKHVTVTTTRLLGPLQHGLTNPPGTFGQSGWDSLNTIASTFNTEYTVNDTNWVAQRLSFPTQSAGRIKYNFNARVGSASFNSGAQLIVSIFSDSDSNPSLIQSLFKAAGFDPTAPTNIGSSYVVPYSRLGIAGTNVAETPSTNTNFTSVEVENPSIWQPGQLFWIVFATQSSGGTNVFISRQNALGTQPAKVSTDSGVSWGGTAGSMVASFQPQLALSSAGATGYGNGNKLALIEPVSGVGMVAKSQAGLHQSYSVIDFDTSVIARKRRQNIDVAFTTTAGAGISGSMAYSRWDYTADIAYEEF